MKKKIYITILLLILISLILLFIDKNTIKEYNKNFFYMDTYINVKLSTTKSSSEVDKIFSDIDYLYSTYHKLSDKYNSYQSYKNVYYLNEVLEPDTKVEIDSRLSDIIRIGMDYYEKTNHLFNIASGNLTEVWKEFINNCDKLPTEDSLNQNINMEDITLDKNTYIKYSNIKLDLGAITKGYATEKVGAYLESIGIKSYVINAGGNVKVGIPYNKENYVIGVTNPDDIENIFTKVKVKSLSVVTSGNYQRYCILDNVNYSHIINPITKYPVFDKKSVTVISKDSTLADIYSTYLYILSVEEGLSLVNNDPSVEAIWYIDKDNIVRSDGFNYE